MKIKMRNTMVLVLAMIVMAGCSRSANEPSPKNTLATAEETVKAFCDLDGNAVRLTSETWSRILPYISWTEEAGWDRTVVIESYRLSKTEYRSERSAVVSVEYDVAGNLSLDYVPSHTKETVLFAVQKTKDGWKIKEPDFMPPHVLMKPLIKHLRETKRLETADKIR